MSSNSEKTTLQRLMELKDLYESGLITKEEMEAKKRQILETDDSPVDNPNGEIENESNVDIPNQADDGYRPGKFCSPTPNVEKEEKSESNNEHGGEQKKETNHKLDKDLKLVLRLSLIVAAVVAVIVVSSIIMTPTDYNKKVEKAVEKHNSGFSRVLSTSGIGESTEENHYVIYDNGGIIFYDGLDRKVPVNAIMPREEGYVFKQVIPVIKDGKPTITYKLLNDGKRSNIKLGINESSGSLITRRTEARRDVLNGAKSICVAEIVSNEDPDIGTSVNTCYYYNLTNPDTVYVFRGSLTHTENESYCEQDFSFLDVVGGNEDGRWSPYSYGDYRFTIRVKFPNLDARLLALDEYIYINEEGFPMDIIRDKLYVTERDGSLLIPTVWFNKGKMNAVYDCLEQDMRRKFVEANSYTLEQLSNAYYQNKLFEGKEFYIITEAESISRAYFSDYQYVIKGTKGLGLETEANIYTNDEGFANLHYPIVIKAKVTYGRTYGERKTLLVPYLTRIFELYDAELIAWGNK